MRVAMVLLLGACSGGSRPDFDARRGDGGREGGIVIVDGGGGDAAIDNGFDKPTVSLHANVEQGPDNWVDVGPADLSCLGTPSNDPSTTAAIQVTTTVRDFQSDAVMPNATVTAFRGEDPSVVLDADTADANGVITVTIPSPTKRFGWKIVDPDALETLVFRQLLAPSTPNQTLPPVKSFSKTTAQTLPALIGISRTPGSSLVLQQMVDCQGRAISGFIATVSTTPGTVNFAPGADTYYFSSSVGLPVRHSQQAMSSGDGFFMVVETPPLATGFVQVWGYPTPNDLANDNLVLVGELAVPIGADRVESGRLEPLRL